jgi:EAL domain-containing protein (putative c-di-GMP-specific phosphodiesterase class I)
LTQWVLETALADACEWKRAGLPLGISVNLSARNLLEEDLPERVQSLIAQHDMAPHHLTLEITESVIMDDPDRSLRTMKRLREQGIIISVDDFGTGYSSLAYLMKLPVNELKIDKSFVTHIDRDPGSATIVRSTVDLAHKLGMLVVAEGVESEKIWTALKRIGCDVGQGYYFSQPVSCDTLLDLIRGDTLADDAPLPPTPTDALPEQPAL